MTTTGGRDPFLAEPAASTEPVVLDGDDIVVEPGESGPQHPRKRTRELIVGGVVAALAIGAIVIALAARDDANGNGKVTTAAPVNPPAASPTADQLARQAAQTTVVPRTKPSNAAPTQPVAPVAPTVLAIAPETPVSAATPPPPVAPPPTSPLASPPSVLRWTTTPAALSIPAGAHVLLRVTVENPSAGTVTLGHPLSCAPTLRRVGGAPIGGAVCAEMAQLLSPQAKATAHYAIYATDTGDASGAPLPAGQYLANIENLHDVKVTVTAS